MPAYAYVLLAVGWLTWVLPFFLVKGGGGATRIDRRARWGIALQAGGYSVLWQSQFWLRPLTPWRLLGGAAFCALASILSWTGARALGRQWRVDAGLNVDHRLVREGPYRIVRHPIYTSMLCILLGTGCLITPLPLLAGAIALFVAGTEIRVRVEDALLESRFGDEAHAYRRTVPAYLPFIR